MGFLSGLIYNFKGLWMGLKTPRLLALGLVRFVAVIILTGLIVGMLLVYHEQIMQLLWARPQSRWILWLWYLLSWSLTVVLMTLSTVISYVFSQIFFSVVVMDSMSRITERMVSGRSIEPVHMSLWKHFLFLIKQEIPRAILPVMLSLVIMMLGWLTPLGPVLTLIAPAVAAIFIAWDNTDLIPARRREPVKARVGYLLKNLSFHLGFGLPFLVPVLNLLFVSFAPVGAALYVIQKEQV